MCSAQRGNKDWNSFGKTPKGVLRGCRNWSSRFVLRHSLETSLEELRSRLIGQLITPDSIEYTDARHTPNIKSERFPAVVRAATEYDVSLAVTFARQQNIPLAVRSGGHSLALHSVVDDALVIDLSGMKRVRIDPEQRIAYVQPGATSGDLGRTGRRARPRALDR